MRTLVLFLSLAGVAAGAIVTSTTCAIDGADEIVGSGPCELIGTNNDKPYSRATVSATYVIAGNEFQGSVSARSEALTFAPPGSEDPQLIKLARSTASAIIVVVLHTSGPPRAGVVRFTSIVDAATSDYGQAHAESYNITASPGSHDTAGALIEELDGVSFDIGTPFTLRLEAITEASDARTAPTFDNFGDASASLSFALFEADGETPVQILEVGIPPAPIPEPGTLALTLLALTLICRRQEFRRAQTERT